MSPVTPLRQRIELGKALLMTALFAVVLLLGLLRPSTASTELIFAMAGLSSYFWLKRSWFVQPQ